MTGRLEPDNLKLPNRRPKLSFNVHASSWISWLSFALAFCLTILAEPGAGTDILQLGYDTYLLLASIALFFLTIVFIQWRMNLALKAQRFDEPRHLVSTGLFAVSRNPMYVCFLLPLSAWALWSPLAAVVAVIAYVVAMNILVIRQEEAALRETFGAEYEDYASRVPRWILPLASVRAKRFVSPPLRSVDASTDQLRPDHCR